jgi:hypothetical protein
MSGTRQRTGLILRFWAWAALLRVLKHVVPLERLVRLVRPRRRSSAESVAVTQAVEAYMASALSFPWRAPGNCLERSLAAYRVLIAANVEPRLVIGVRITPSEGVQGHVWVTVGGRALAEPPDRVASYTEILNFDAEARRHSRSGADDLLGQMRIA